MSPEELVRTRPELISSEISDIVFSIFQSLPRDKQKRAQALREFANRLKIPNECRENIKSLEGFITGLGEVISRGLWVKEKGLEVGMHGSQRGIKGIVIVKKIHPSFYITIEQPDGKLKSVGPSGFIPN